MGHSIVDRRAADKKPRTALVGTRLEQKPAQERPDPRSSFDAIYKSDRFTLEAAVKAFIKS